MNSLDKFISSGIPIGDMSSLYGNVIIGKRRQTGYSYAQREYQIQFEKFLAERKTEIRDKKIDIIINE